MIPLRGKLALITGGSRGIGLAVARAFAAQGASTIIVGRDAATLRTAVESVREAAAAAGKSSERHRSKSVAEAPSPPQPQLPRDSSPTLGWWRRLTQREDERQQQEEVDEVEEEKMSEATSSDADAAAAAPFHRFAQGDVRHAETWTEIYRKLSSGHFGRRGVLVDGRFSSPDRVDILINCAGVSQKSIILSTMVESIDDIIDANLKSTILGCKFISKHMVRTRRLTKPGMSDTSPDRTHGLSIINVSSLMATRGGWGASVYAASKAGILGFTSAMSLELGDFGIRVNALVPGYIETTMIESLNRDALSRLVPLKRVGQVEEVADAAVFLAQNSYANNCHLTIDGGLSASFGRKTL